MLCRETLGDRANGFGPVLVTPIALSLLSASLLHVPRAFRSTPIALCASKSISEHPYRTLRLCS